MKKATVLALFFTNELIKKGELKLNANQLQDKAKDLAGFIDTLAAALAASEKISTPITDRKAKAPSVHVVAEVDQTGTPL